MTPFRLPPQDNAPIDIHVFGSPTLAIEIGGSSFKDDLGAKRLLYERLGVSEYWVVNVAEQQVYEYFDGEVFAMAETSLPHADIALNVASLLRAQLQGHCKGRNSDAKVGITEDGPFVYLDVSVSCD